MAHVTEYASLWFDLLLAFSNYLYNRFGTSERQWVEAQVYNAKQQAILLALKAQVTSDEAHIHHDIHSLRYPIFFLL